MSIYGSMRRSRADSQSTGGVWAVLDGNCCLLRLCFPAPFAQIAIREFLYDRPQDQNRAAHAYEAFSVAMLCCASGTLPAVSLRSSKRGRAADGHSGEGQ